MGKGFYVKLTEGQIRVADYWAHKRHERAAKVKLDEKKLRATPAQKLAMDILGCRTEYAGWLFIDPDKSLGVVWHKYREGSLRGLPDVGDFIDVKGVSEDRRGLASPDFSLKDDWAYLLISAENHPYYWIVGWLWGDELRLAGKISFPERPAYLVSIADQYRVKELRRPMELRDVVRERILKR